MRINLHRIIQVMFIFIVSMVGSIIDAAMPIRGACFAVMRIVSFSEIGHILTLREISFLIKRG